MDLPMAIIAIRILSSYDALQSLREIKANV